MVECPKILTAPQSPSDSENMPVLSMDPSWENLFKVTLIFVQCATSNWDHVIVFQNLHSSMKLTRTLSKPNWIISVANLWISPTMSTSIWPRDLRTTKEEGLGSNLQDSWPSPGAGCYASEVAQMTGLFIFYESWQWGNTSLVSAIM